MTLDKSFSTFYTLFYEALKFAPTTERQFFKTISDYSVRYDKCSTDVDISEIKRDFAIYLSRYSKVRNKLIQTHHKVQLAAEAIRQKAENSETLQADACVSYYNWFTEKSDFISSLKKAMNKWDRMLKQP